MAYMDMQPKYKVSPIIAHPVDMITRPVDIIARPVDIAVAPAVPFRRK